MLSDCYLQAGAMLGDAFLHQLPHAFGMILLSGWWILNHKVHPSARDSCHCRGLWRGLDVRNFTPVSGEVVSAV